MLSWNLIVGHFSDGQMKASYWLNVVVTQLQTEELKFSHIGFRLDLIRFGQL